jgi:DNA-binding MarR family transcriptional regulator
MNVNPQQVTNQPEDVVFRNPIDEFGWAKISHLLTEDNAVSDGAYRTYVLLLKFAQQKRKLWAGVETLAKLRHRNAATISRHLAELQERKLITRKRRLGTSWITVIEDVTKIYVAKIQSCKNARLKIAKMRDKSSQKCDVKKNKQKNNEKKEKKCVPPTADTHGSLSSENQNAKSHSNKYVSSTARGSTERENNNDQQIIANNLLEIAFGAPYGNDDLTNVAEGKIGASERRTAYYVAGELLKDVQNGVISRDDLDEAIQEINGESEYLLDTATTLFEDMPANKRIFRVMDAVSAYWGHYRG